MAEKITQQIVKITDHPLEGFFEMEPNSTEVIKTEQKTELVKAAEYDDKDNEVEEHYQEIYDKAMSSHTAIQEAIEDIDPKWAARNFEVANQTLQIALDAAKSKAALKAHKDKLNKAAKGGTTTNNNIIIDTNSLIEQLKRPKIIDVPVVDTPANPDPNKNEKG